MVRVLFACSLGLCRSAWASHVYTRLGVGTRYGGFDDEAAQRLADADYRWADFIAVFEPSHVEIVQHAIRRTGSKATAVHVPIARLLTTKDPLFRACLDHTGRRLGVPDTR